MKMTLKELNEKYLGLTSLGKLTLPTKLRYAITCNIEDMQKHVERIEKMRKDLCERYCKKDDAGNPVMEESIINGVRRSNYSMDKKEEKEMNKEYEEFLETEEEVEIKKVKISVLEECEEKERYDLPNVAQQLAMNFMLEE